MSADVPDRGARFVVAPGRRAYGNLKEDAAEFIRDAIVSGTFPAGSKIDQDRIAEDLGISRAPVREALIELAQKGFVIAVPRRGAFVAALTLEDIEDYYDIVAVVFGRTTRRAVTQLTPGDLAELGRLNREIAGSTDVTKRRELNRRFFRTIAIAGSSPRLDSILLFLGGVFPGSFYYESPTWETNETRYRRQLLRSLKAGDEKAAAQTSEDHLHACARLTVEHLTASGYWPADTRSTRLPGL